MSAAFERIVESTIAINTIQADLPNKSGIINGLQNVEDKFLSGFDPWGDYLFGSFMIVVGLVSVVGNSLSVHVFRQKGKEITVPEVLLLNIAVVDLFLAVASHPATIVAAFSHSWIFGEVGCTIYGATCYFLGLATIMSLTTLAIFRFVKACYPSKGQWLTASRTRYVILAIYVYSLIWALLPLSGWGGYDVEPFGLSCTLAWKQPDQGGKMYILMVCVWCVGLPTVLIIGSHIGILLQIRRAGKMFSNKSAGKQSGKAEMQFIRVSFGVCFGFLVAWLPYAALSCWSAFGDSSSIPMWMTPIPVLLAKSSIAYNPVIYVLLTRRYRVDFTKALRELLRLSGHKRVEGNDDANHQRRNTREETRAISLSPTIHKSIKKQLEAEDDGDESEAEVVAVIQIIPVTTSS